MSHDDAPLIQKVRHRTFEVRHLEHDLLIAKTAHNYELRLNQPQAIDQPLFPAHSCRSIYEVLGHSYLEIAFGIEYLVAPID